MTLTPTLVVAQTRSLTSWRVYVWKQHSEHIMDWNGCNYRLVGVPGQPRAGFADKIDAARWGMRWLHDGGDVMRLARSTDGTHFNERRDFEPLEEFAKLYGIKHDDMDDDLATEDR